MASTSRFEWPYADWNSEWQEWQAQYEDGVTAQDSTVFSIFEGTKEIFAELPDAQIVLNGSARELHLSGDLVIVSRTLNTQISIDSTDNLVLLPGYMIGAMVTPGAVGAQSTEFEIVSTADIDPDFRVYGYIDDAYAINWFNGSRFEYGEDARPIFSFSGTGGGGTDDRRVKVSTDDTTPAFLEDKLVQGTNVTIAVQNAGGNETLLISSTAAGSTLHHSLTDLATVQTDHPYYLYTDGTNNMLANLNMGGYAVSNALGIRSTTGPLYISDGYRAGSSWSVSNGIQVFASSSEWSSIETLIGSEGSIASAIIAASNTSSLAQYAVGYGSATSRLTGDATNFKWNYTNYQLSVGPGTPSYMGATNYSTYINGLLEVVGTSHIIGQGVFYTSATMRDTVPLYFGNSSNASIRFSTASSPNRMVLGLGAASNAIVVCEQADVGAAWNHSLQSNPTIFIQSADATSINKYLGLAHNGSDSYIFSGTGSVLLGDAYRAASTWTGTSGIRLFTTSQEWTDLKALMSGDEGSIAKAILTASAGSGSAGLDATAVGYGSVGNALTGDAANFHWLATEKQLHIGPGTPGSLSTTNYGLYINGPMETDGSAYFDGTVTFNSTSTINGVMSYYAGPLIRDGIKINIGNSNTVDSVLFHSTDNTVNTLVLGLGTESRSIVLCERDDSSTNWGKSQQTNPTLYVQSSDATHVDYYLGFTHNQTDGFIFSGAGSVMFSDAYRSGSTWTGTSGIKLFASSSEWSAIEALIGSEGSIAAAIIAASAGTGSVTLASTAVGYGSGTNQLTGDAANFKWNANYQLLIGPGTPGNIGTTNYSLYVNGASEFDGSIYLDGSVAVNGVMSYYANPILRDSIRLNIGNSTSLDSVLFHSTDNTVNTLVLGLGTESRGFVICDRDDTSTNWGHAQQADPTLWLHSSSTSLRYMALSHNQTDGMISSGYGSIMFSDAYRSGSTWTGTSGIRLFASSAEWSAIEALIGSEGSLAAAIIAASSGSGSVTLAGGAVGYGSATNQLTGDASRFIWDYTNYQLKIGTGTPNRIGATNFSEYITGAFEVDGAAYFDGIVTLNSTSTINGTMTFYASPIIRDNIGLYLGNSSDSVIYHSTGNTPDSLVVGVGAESNYMVICATANAGIDWAHAQSTNPALYIQSALYSTSDDKLKYIAAYHNQTNAIIESGYGSVMFTDYYRTNASCTWDSAGIALAASYTEWNNLETYIESEGSLFAAIMKAPYLTSTYVGYGGANGHMTGSSSLRFNTNNQLLIGTGTPGTIGSTAGSLYVTGNFEVSGGASFSSFSAISDSYISGGSLRFNDDIELYLGSSNDVVIVYGASVQTYDQLIVGLDDVHSNTLIICEKTYAGTNWTKGGILANPTLYIQANGSTNAQNIYLYHDTANGMIGSSTGTLKFNDAYRTWTDTGIKLFSSASEWTLLKTLMGGTEGSLAYAILTASTYGAVSLTQGYVAFGNGTGITGESNCFWDATNNRLGIGISSSLLAGLHIGTGAPDKISASSTSLYVTGNAEIDGSTYFDGTTTIASNVSLYLGTCALQYDTTQTNDALMIGVSTSSKRLILCDVGDIDYDFAHSAGSHPSFIIHSANQSATEYSMQYHDGASATYISATGGFSFRPAAVAANTVSGASFAMGASNTLAGDYCLSVGISNSITSSYNFTLGQSNSISSNLYNIVAGNSNTVTGGYNFINGIGISSTGSSFSMVLGSNNTVSHDYCEARGEYVASWWKGAEHFCGRKAYSSDSAGSAQSMAGLSINARTTNTTITNMYYDGTTPFYIPIGHVAFLRLHLMSSCSGDTTGVYGWNVRDVYLCMWYTTSGCASRIISNTEIANFGSGTPISTTVYTPTDDNAGTFTFRIQCTTPSALTVYHVAHIYSAIITKAALGITS